MTLPEYIKSFVASIEESLKEKSFVKVSIGGYKGTEENLKNIYIKRVLIKKEEKLSFTYRYKTKDIVKNYSIFESLALIQKSLSEGFRVGTLFTVEFDLLYENIRDKKITIKEKKPSYTEVPDLSHDKNKNRLIEAKPNSYLTELGIADQNGNILKSGQDKYRQINHYVEILSSLIKEISAENIKNIVDMGCGKGYLTFALHDYFNTVLKQNPQVVGVEMRQELVGLCNETVHKSNLSGLTFKEGTIADYNAQDCNILIALHACDTATDDAIAKGIQTGAELIVVAPCCHKQIRREMEKSKKTNDLEFLTKYGIFMERQAEMVTDGIRALVLEYFGYKTKVFEFVSDAHTPKNVMIVGIKNAKATPKNAQILEKIQAAKTYFGIEKHYLEKILSFE